jgi:hypothetical protein
MINFTVKESWLLQTVHVLRVNGKTTNSKKAKVSKPMKMVTTTKVNTKMASGMAKEVSTSRAKTEATLETGSRINLKEMALA